MLLPISYTFRLNEPYFSFNLISIIYFIYFNLFNPKCPYYVHKLKKADKENLYNINISHQQITNYFKTSAICIKPFVDQYPYEKRDVFTAYKTYIKICGIKNFIRLITNASTRFIIGYQISDNRGVRPCVWHFKVLQSRLRTSY